MNFYDCFVICAPMCAAFMLVVRHFARRWELLDRKRAELSARRKLAIAFDEWDA